MDRHIAKEFANTLLDACQEHDSETISPQCLIDPKFLAAFSAFLGNTLGSQTSLPQQLQETLQNVLHNSGLRQFDDVFGGDVTRWIRFETDNPLGPGEDTATRLYDKLSKLPKPTTPLQKAMRQVYIVELYYLRKTFNEYFTSPNREPLTRYIGILRGLEDDTVRSILKESVYAGERLDAIARELGGFGALLLPHKIARTTLEKRLSIKDPELNDFNGVVQSLREQGVFRNESTQTYYDLAARFFSGRYDDGIRLVESLCQNARYNRWSGGRPRKRIPLDRLIKPKDPRTHVATQLAEDELLPDAALRPWDAAPLQSVADSSKA